MKSNPQINTLELVGNGRSDVLLKCWQRSMLVDNNVSTSIVTLFIYR